VQYCHSKLSVHLSVMLRYCEYIVCITSKITLISGIRVFALCGPQHHGSISKGTPTNFCWNKSGVSKVGLSSICEMAEDRAKYLSVYLSTLTMNNCQYIALTIKFKMLMPWRGVSHMLGNGHSVLKISHCVACRLFTNQ